jgi:hypothetical protein
LAAQAATTGVESTDLGETQPRAGRDRQDAQRAAAPAGGEASADGQPAA